MSKVDAMRALREARHAATSKAPVAAPPRASTQAAPPTRRGPLVVVRDEPPADVNADESADPGAVEELCGHRNMGGKSCTREIDHVKNGTKNHRYG